MPTPSLPTELVEHILGQLFLDPEYGSRFQHDAHREANRLELVSKSWQQLARRLRWSEHAKDVAPHIRVLTIYTLYGDPSGRPQPPQKESRDAFVTLLRECNGLSKLAVISNIWVFSPHSASAGPCTTPLSDPPSVKDSTASSLFEVNRHEDLTSTDVERLEPPGRPSSVRMLRVQDGESDFATGCGENLVLAVSRALGTAPLQTFSFGDTISDASLVNWFGARGG
ncbi:hypothetical protein JCM8547_003745 [Rhodosporidiobolus lusitaniae]